MSSISTNSYNHLMMICCAASLCIKAKELLDCTVLTASCFSVIQASNSYSIDAHEKIGDHDKSQPDSLTKASRMHSIRYTVMHQGQMQTLMDIPLAICVAVLVLFSIVVAASGKEGRSSQASLTTSSSWSDDLSTDEALAVLSNDELQRTGSDVNVLTLSGQNPTCTYAHRVKTPFTACGCRSITLLFCERSVAMVFHVRKLQAEGKDKCGNPDKCIRMLCATTFKHTVYLHAHGF